MLLKNLIRVISLALNWRNIVLANVSSWIIKANVFSCTHVTIDAKNDISLWQKFVQLSKHR